LRQSAGLTPSRAKPTLPFLPQMEAAPPIPKQHAGKTFVIAISLLGIIALAQFFATGVIFVARMKSTPMPAASATPVPAAPASPAPVEMATTETGTEYLVQSELFESAEEVPPLPRPTPVPQIRPEESSEARMAELLNIGKALRDRGDTSTAITRFREALAISPANPQAISELAITYEKMGQGDKAAEQWRKLFEMGETAGIYYAAAEAKLRAAEAPQQTVAEPGAALKDSEGMQPGSTLGLGEIALSEATDPSAWKKLLLKIPIKIRPSSKVEVRDVVIQVFFYDLVDNQNVVQTNANVSSQFTTLPADWTEDEMEVLEVEYLQPRDPKQVKPAEDRKFYGYIVRIYYKNELQDMRAEPLKLLKQYPPPLTIQSE
jgi:tetratricopeptide (TPR) repeat protein